MESFNHGVTPTTIPSKGPTTATKERNPRIQATNIARKNKRQMIDQPTERIESITDYSSYPKGMGSLR
jgi:hypothetical protein